MIYEKLKRILLIFIIITFCILYLINEKEVLCETNFEHFLPQLKEILYKQLFLLIKQDDFIMQYDAKFYQHCILKKEFIKTFLEHVDFENLINNNAGKDVNTIKYEILKEFHNYIQDKQKEYEYQIKIIQNTFLTIFERMLPYIEQYYNFYKPEDNASIFIKTPGFYQHLKDYEHKIIQDFIREGFAFKVSLDENENGIVISLSWNTIVFYYKKILI